MDPLQWMGAVRMRVQTADKNITIIHTTPVHFLQNLRDEYIFSWFSLLGEIFLEVLVIILLSAFLSAICRVYSH